MSIVCYFDPPIPISSEKNVVKALKQTLEWHGWKTKTDFKLSFGSIDLVAWNNEKVLLFEAKHNASFNELAHALGQLLVYREQIKDSREMKGIVHTRLSKISKEQYGFLKRVFAKYDVELQASSYEEEEW